jgi:hypothetical protein
MWNKVDINLENVTVEIHIHVANEGTEGDSGRVDSDDDRDAGPDRVVRKHRMGVGASSHDWGFGRTRNVAFPEDLD